MKCPIVKAVDDVIRVPAIWPNLSSRFITKDLTSSCSDYHRNSKKLNEKVFSGCGACRQNFMTCFEEMKETSPALKFEYLPLEHLFPSILGQPLSPQDNLKSLKWISAYQSR
jgi:hypothetical protein